MPDTTDQQPTLEQEVLRRLREHDTSFSQEAADVLEAVIRERDNAWHNEIQSSKSHHDKIDRLQAELTLLREVAKRADMVEDDASMDMRATIGNEHPYDVQARFIDDLRASLPAYKEFQKGSE